MKYNKELKWTSRTNKYGREVFSARVGRSVFYIVEDGVVDCPGGHQGNDKYFAAMNTESCRELLAANSIPWDNRWLVKCVNYLSTDDSRAQALQTAKETCELNWKKTLKLIDKNNSHISENS